MESIKPPYKILTISEVLKKTILPWGTLYVLQTERIPGKKKSRFAEPEIFLAFEIDPDFLRP